MSKETYGGVPLFGGAPNPRRALQPRDRWIIAAATLAQKIRESGVYLCVAVTPVPPQKKTGDGDFL